MKIVLKKLIAVFLAISLSLTMLPIWSAFAEGGSDTVLQDLKFDFEDESQLDSWKIEKLPDYHYGIEKYTPLGSETETGVLRAGGIGGDKIAIRYNGDLSNSVSAVSKISGKIAISREPSVYNPIQVYYDYDSDVNKCRYLALASENGKVYYRNYDSDKIRNEGHLAISFAKGDKSNQWLSFEVSYSYSGVVIRLSDQFGVYEDLKFDIDNFSIGTFAVGTGGGTMAKSFFDDIEFKFTPSPEIAANEFKTKHSKILYSDISKITLADKADYEAAQRDFDNLSIDAINLIPEEAANLSAIKQLIEDLGIQEQYGYKQPTYNDVITDDFSTDDILNKIYYTVSDNYYSAQIAEDPTNAENKVLKVAGKSGDVINWRSFAWPEGASLKRVSFDIMFETTSPTPHRGFGLQYSYVDSDNFNKIVTWSEPPDGGWMYYPSSKRNGVPDYDMGHDMTSLFEWVSVDIVYNITEMTAVISFSPKSNPENVTGISVKLSHPKGRFMFSVPSAPSWMNPEGTVYYDNLNIEFQKGDWDDDIKITEPNVTYTGNTWIKNGETQLLYGEKIYSTVTGVEISQIANADVSNATPQYISQETFYSNGDSSVYATAAQHHDGENQQNVSLLQATDDSFKFKIPDDYSEGIYSVKLNAKYSGVEDKYVYINYPRILNIVGEEGRTALQGDSLSIYGHNLVGKYDGSAEITDVDEIDGLGVYVKIVGSNGYVKNLKINSVESKYRLTATLPDDIPAGDYEVMVYNGYGDATCFSAPFILKVKNRSNSLESLRTANEFNVKDFGAIGDGRTPDTAAFVSTFNAAAKAGGGTVFVPQGAYNITNQLKVPDNVKLIGAGTKLTTILVTAYKFAYGELPDGSFVLGNNVEVCDMSFFAQRAGHMISATGAEKGNANHYVHDIRIEMSPTSGMISGGSHSGSLIEGLSPYDAWMMAYREAKGSSTGVIIRGKENAKVYNNDVVVALSCVAVTEPYSEVYNNTASSIIGGGYDYYTGGWSSIGSYQFFENNDYNNQMFPGAPDTSYVARNSLGGIYWNNRELIINDAQMVYGIGRNGIAQKVNDTQYRLLSKISGGIDFKGKMLIVLSGQGKCQTRRIVEHNGDLITLESPFTVEPNRNSRVGIHNSYLNSTYCQNEFYDANTVGLYGVAAGIVYDGNIYSRIRNTIYPYDYGPNWYISWVNQLYDDSYIFQSGGATDLSGESNDIHGIGTNAVVAITVRNNTLLDGHNFMVRTVEQDSVVDLIIEGNYIENSIKPAISVSNSETTADGVIINNNTIVNCNSDYSIGNTVATNDQGYARILLNNDASGTGTFVLGDVDLNGKVTLKDASMIRMYVLGKIELSEEQIKRADVNISGDVTLLDSVLIKQYLLGKAELGKNVDLSDSSDEWIGPF